MAGVRIEFESKIQLGHLIQAVVGTIIGTAGILAVYYGLMSVQASQQARLDKLDIRLTNEVTVVTNRIAFDERQLDKAVHDDSESFTYMRAALDRLLSQISDLRADVASVVHRSPTRNSN